MSVAAQLPMHLQAAGAHLLLRTIDPAAMDWTAPFFRDAVPAIGRAHGMAAYSDWIKTQEPPDPDYSDVGLITHVARCGSTLLVRNIAASDQVAVLSEPPFFSTLHGRLGAFLDEREALNTSLAVLAPWRQWAKVQGKRLIIKLSSQLSPFLRLLQQNMPGVQIVALHREPLPVLESLDRKRTSRLQSEADRNAAYLHPGIMSLSNDRYILAAADRYLRAIAGMSELRSAPCFVGYHELGQRYADILTALRLSPPALPWSTAYNAKARGEAVNTPYTPVVPERLEQFASDNATLLAILQAEYDDFCGVIAARSIPSVKG